MSFKTLIVNDSAFQLQHFHSVCTIGVSTGNPEALNILIPDLPENFPIPVLVTQHMPPLFTKSLSDGLDKISKLKVIENNEGAEIRRET